MTGWQPDPTTPAAQLPFLGELLARARRKAVRRLATAVVAAVAAIALVFADGRVDVADVVLLGHALGTAFLLSGRRIALNRLLTRLFTKPLETVDATEKTTEQTTKGRRFAVRLPTAAGRTSGCAATRPACSRKAGNSGWPGSATGRSSCCPAWDSGRHGSAICLCGTRFP
ncbi:hypothetical protein AB0383_00790 [Amycolatopsis sp. NPDC051373]|uniref:hypothetical protein n=1 Tax=Amycolatopsis sp. NPDC051373 TaxID=3155801 RepID=UPI00344DDA2D